LGKKKHKTHHQKPEIYQIRCSPASDDVWFN